MPFCPVPPRETPAEAEAALRLLQRQLAGTLGAVYLHGSCVAGGRRPQSDIDLLAVIERPLTAEERACLTAELMALSGRYPVDPAGRPPLEVIIFHRADLAALSFPPRYELLYGEWLRDDYAAGKPAGPGADPELTLVLAPARQDAEALFGPPASALLPAISEADIRRAIKAVLPALISTLEGDERNVLLTLARMWRTLSVGDFVAKDVAADWAAARLPADGAAVLTAARDAYLTGDEDGWQDRQPELRRTVAALQGHIQAGLQIKTGL